MLFDLVISEGIIVTMTGDNEPFIGSIGIKDGKIETIQKGRMYPEDGRNYISARGKIVMPGLINGHCHGDMTAIRGMADDLTLLEQNEKFAPLNFLYDELSEQDRFFSRQLTYIEALKSGTTFIAENMYWGLGLDSIKAMVETGISGALAEDIRYDFTEPENLQTIDFLKQFSKQCRKNELIPVLGSVSEEDFKEELLKEIFTIADKCELLVTQHLAETKWRVELSKKNTGHHPVTALNEFGLLSERLIGSHAIYINEEEIKMMQEAGIKVINTPVCEMKISDGIAPIPEFLNHRIPTGLGTDGALWNNSNDMFREMKGLVLLHSINSGVRQINAQQALECATINGAKVFGIEEEKGSLCEGKDADIVLVNADASHMRPLRIGAHENVISSLVYNATGQDVESVFIKGRPVVLNKEVMTIDEDEIISEVQAVSEKIAANIPVDAFIM